MRGIFSTVTNLYWLTIWLNIHPRYHRWDSIRVYHQLSDTFIGTYSRGEDIPPKPRP